MLAQLASGGVLAALWYKAGITLVVPEENERAYIHDKYMNELVKGVFLPETRQRLCWRLPTGWPSRSTYEG
jgi:aspartate/glutamate racemase